MIKRQNFPLSNLFITKLILEVGDDEITPSIIARKLGVIIDCNLKLDKYMQHENLPFIT